MDAAYKRVNGDYGTEADTEEQGGRVNLLVSFPEAFVKVSVH